MYSKSISRKGIENKSITQILNKKNEKKMVLSKYYLTFWIIMCVVGEKK